MTRILYLHGFASGPTSSKARFFRDRLEAAGAQFEIPDLAGGDFEHLTITGQLAAIERAARGEPVSLVGSSMGGYLAALYAGRHPETTRAVLLAPAFGITRLWLHRIGAQAIEHWRRTGFMEVFHYGENRRCRLAFDLFADAGRYENYPAFTQPALLFHGANDDVVPARFSEEFAAAHSNAKLELLDSGHDLLNVLDYLASKITDFLVP